VPFCQRRQFLMNCLIPRYSNPFLFRGYVSRSPPLARAPLLGVVVAAMSPRTLAYHARNHLPTYTCARPLPRPLCEHTAAAHAAQHGSNLHTAHRRATAGPEERRGCRYVRAAAAAAPRQLLPKMSTRLGLPEPSGRRPAGTWPHRDCMNLTIASATWSAEPPSFVIIMP
jgi:hypothetical protein